MNNLWHVESTMYRGNPQKPYEWQIACGINDYGDGPHHTVCIVKSSPEDADEIVRAHNWAVEVANARGMAKEAK